MPDEPAHPRPPTADAADWFDVGRLLDVSRPAPVGPLFLLPPLGLAMMVGALLLTLFAPARIGVPLGVGLLLSSVACTVIVARAATRARDERRRVRDADELVTLRRWPEAAAALRSLLARPMRLDVNRRPALVALARVLGRYGLHDEAIDVAEEVLDDPRTDPATKFAVGCGRAVLLLQGGRLGDANDALSRLRGEVRQVQRAVERARRQAEDGETPAEPTAAEDDSVDLPAEALLDADDPDAVAPPAAANVEFEPAALIFAEIYRDVQTNHHQEAVELYLENRQLLPRQLGVRAGDAHAMAALAAEGLGRPDEARQYWSEATCLVPTAELTRRYPELASIASLYPATVHPAEGALS